MSILNKRYCSHCGTPNTPSNQTCSKCSKPISSALRARVEDNDEQEVVIVKKKRPVSKARIVYQDDDDGFDGEIAVPSSNDIVIERPQKLTVGGLKNGAQVPTFGQIDTLSNDIEVGSRSYFHDQKLD